MEDRIKELENTLETCIVYIKNCIGSSYCSTDQSDYELLNEVEDTLGVPKTDRNHFY